ncbi:MAG: discoidin domain-containing protein [Chthoniobacter sp.]|uniref:discoidin domain-containing protein n=1 Tax=Chthoniobacter sp. TaxID=2510640 RepID=UPI0032A6D7CC
MFSRCWPLLYALGASWLATSPAAAQEQRWLEPVARALSPSYRQILEREQTLQSELAKLPQPPVSQQSERIGWHSQFSRTANATKWLQLDLHRAATFDAVVLVPVDVAYGAHPGPGFGFPLRFRVEASDDAAFSEPRLLVAYDDADFPNPGNAPVFLSTPGAAARFIRITATRLWPRDDLALFALGEVFVLRAGLNVGVGAAVTASDAYNNAPTWEPANATDGQSMLGAAVEIAPAPGNGWHARTERSADTVKWVQVDLGSEVPLDEVRLYPARPKDFPARRGFGFPPRFRVEASNDVSFAQSVMLFDQTQTDYVNPAENPVVVPVKDVRARFIRVTATKLWERTNDFIFALAELGAFSGGKDVALGTTVTSSDSIEAPSWARRFLVDGFNSQGRILEVETWLRGLSRRREIEHELQELEAERVHQMADLTALASRYLLVSLFVLVAVLGWWLQRRVRARRLEVEALRQRIAGDLHDEIGSNLGSIALLSQMALRQPGDAHADLAEINRVARETAASMRDIVWLIKPGASGAEDFVMKLRETAAVMLAGLEWQFDGGTLTKPISLEWKREILLIFKEALHNIRRHADAKQVTIRLADTGGEFVMQISDDGTAFDVLVATAGHGLSSQRQRAQTIGGELQIDSASGSGTTVTLRVKLDSSSPVGHS